MQRGLTQTVRPTVLLPRHRTEREARLGDGGVRHLALAAAAVLACVAAPSLVGPFDPRITVRVIPAVAVGAAIVWLGPRAAVRLPWRWLVAAAFIASISWAVALSASDGAAALTEPVSRPAEYLTTSESVASPRTFLASFTNRIDGYPIHVRGHPPGMVLLLWGLGEAGLGGAGWAAAVMIAAGCSAACAALIASRETSGEDLARAAAPFLVLLPAFVWIATSADALFMGVAAWGVTLAVLATGRIGARAAGLSFAGGAVLGCAIFLTYGAVLLAGIPLIVTIARRRVRLILPAAIAASAVVAVFALLGFWWLDGLLATRREYLAGAGGVRGYWFFLVANLGALALAIGPATVAGLTKLRSRGPWLLVGGAIAGVMLADLSGMSKGEVERIWLLFVPWLGLAAGALAASGSRAWLAANASAGLALQMLLRSPW